MAPRPRKDEPEEEGDESSGSSEDEGEGEEAPSSTRAAGSEVEVPQQFGEKFPCSVCGRLFRRARNARNHAERHKLTNANELRPFSCGCGVRVFGLAARPFLLRHFCYRHCWLTCSCSNVVLKQATFAKSSDLYRHVRSVHAGAFPFANGALATASSASSGGGPTTYDCPRCGRGFTRRDALARHIRSSDKNPCDRRREAQEQKMAAGASTHGLSIEEMDVLLRSVMDNCPPGKFTCYMCGTSFSRKDALGRHVKRTAGTCGNGEPPRQEPAARGGSGGAASARRPRLPPSRGAPMPEPMYEPYFGAVPDYMEAGLDSRTPETPMDLLAHAATSPASYLDLPAAASSRLVGATEPECPCCSGLSVPIHSLHHLYPTIPPHLLPPIAFLDTLVSFYHRFEAAYQHIIHVYTFMEDIKAGKADLTVLFAVLECTVRHVEANGDLPDSEGWKWKWLQSAHVKDGVKQFCRDMATARMEQAFRGELSNNMAALEDLARGLHLARLASMSHGDAGSTQFYDSLLIELFPMLKFGEMRGDMLPLLPTTNCVAAEMRRRLCSVYVMGDVAGTDLLSSPIRLFPPSGVVRDPESGLFVPAWANMFAPCEDTVFDAMRNGVEPATMVKELRIGDYYSWVERPVDDSDRVSFLKEAVGGFLTRGSTSAVNLSTSIWERALHYRLACRSKGYMLHAPPPSDEQVSKQREVLLAACADFWKNLPVQVQQVDAESDCAALTHLSAQFYGPHMETQLAQHLVFWHIMTLGFHVPYDVLVEQDPGKPMSQAELELWPFSQAFVEAQYHAIAVARIARAALITASDSMVTRSVPATWPQYVVRACFVNIIAIRKLRHLLHLAPAGAELIDSAQITMSELLRDIAALVADFPMDGDLFEHFGRAAEVISGLLQKPQKVDDPDDVWVWLAPEDARKVKGLRVDNMWDTVVEM